jgi:hypothetical protein
MDGALGVDPVEPDPNRLELATLGGATDRLRVQAQQLRELACL